MSLSTAREAASSSGSEKTLPEVYASIARRASSPAETPSRRLISRSFFTLLRGTRYCWRMRSSAFADIQIFPSRDPCHHTVSHTHTQSHTQRTRMHLHPKLILGRSPPSDALRRALRRKRSAFPHEDRS